MRDRCSNCEHNFVQHDLSPEHILGRDARGAMPDSTCARFYSPLPEWTADTLCQCGNPHSAHERLTPAESVSALNTTSQTATQTAPPATTAHLGLPLPPAPAGPVPPITPYQSVLSNTTNATQSATQLRSNSLAADRDRMQSTRTSQPRPQAQSSIGGNRNGRGFGQGTDDATTKEFSVAVLPFKSETVTSPTFMKQIYPFKFSDEQLQRLLPALQQQGLYLANISLPSTGDVWQQIDTQVQQGLLTKFAYVQRDSDQVIVPTSFHEMNFAILVPGKANVRQRFRRFKVSDVSRYDCTVPYLLERVVGLKGNGNCTVKNTLDQRPILFLAPKNNHLFFRNGHQCEGVKLWADLNIISMPSEDVCTALQCTPVAGPSTSSVAAPTAVGPRRRSDSESSLPPRNRRRIEAPAPLVLEPPSTSSGPPSAPDPPSTAVQKRRIIIPSKTLVPRVTLANAAGFDELYDWQMAVFQHASRNTPDHIPQLRGTSVNDMALSFLAQIFSFTPYYKAGQSYRFPSPNTLVTRTARSVLSYLLQPSVLVTTEGGLQESMGRGPFRAVLVATLATITNPHHAVYGNSFDLLSAASGLRSIRPVNTTDLLLGSALRSRQESLFSAGVVAAIHVHALMQVPYPLSPWLIFYAMTNSPAAIDSVTYQQIAYIDPHAAEELEPWFNFSHTDVLSPDSVSLHKIPSLARKIGLNMADLMLPRSKEDHALYTRAVRWSVLIGISRPNLDDRVTDFVNGFRIPIEEPPKEKPEEESEKDKALRTICAAFYGKPEKALRFLLGMSDGLPQAPQEVTDRIQYCTTIPKASGVLYEMCLAMQFRIRRYLHGCGNPTVDPVDVLFDDDEQDPNLFRVKHFLRAISNTEVLPSGGICIRLKPAAVLQGVHFHTCTNDIDLPVSLDNVEMFAERCTLDDGVVTAFDLWFFMALDGSENMFNGEFPLT
ncbi:hypothetical protein ONZ45_g15890 [Pleurotus djamor]|nr:hypothetical protein ONZ45_g15890 [Pleurotus djamor]